MLDTARLYGESESVLGQTMGCSRWRIVSKTRKFSEINEIDEVQTTLAADLCQSLSELSLASLHGLLVHDAADLGGNKGAYLWEAMARARANGLVAKIGASIYDRGQIESLIDRFDLDIIQLPLSAIDQRLTRGGILRELKERGIEIHARSAFLQGLLLVPVDRIDPRFGILRTRVAGLQSAWRELGLTPLEGALSAVLWQPEIDHVIVGTTSPQQLREILAAAHKASQTGGKFAIEQWALDDETYINPARWGQLLRS